MTSPITTERPDAVLEVTINRPKANAIDAPTSRIMGETFAKFRDDPELRVAILTGAGEKFFCPGWDLKAAAEGEAPDSDYGVGGFGGLSPLGVDLLDVIFHRGQAGRSGSRCHDRPKKE